MCVRLPQALLVLEPGQGGGSGALGSVPREFCMCAGPIPSPGHPLSQAWGPPMAAVLWGFQGRCLGAAASGAGLNSWQHSVGFAPSFLREKLCVLSPSRPRVAVPGGRAQGKKCPRRCSRFHVVSSVFRV